MINRRLGTAGSKVGCVLIPRALWCATLSVRLVIVIFTLLPCSVNHSVSALRVTPLVACQARRKNSQACEHAVLLTLRLTYVYMDPPSLAARKWWGKNVSFVRLIILELFLSDRMCMSNGAHTSITNTERLSCSGSLWPTVKSLEGFSSNRGQPWSTTN